MRTSLIHTFVVVISSLILVSTSLAQFPAACDRDKSCIGNAYNGVQTSGKGANSILVTKTNSQSLITTALTVEMWISAKPQANRKVYLGGSWGPVEDDDDQWCLYFAPNGNLTFEVNGIGTKRKAADNTIVSTSYAAYYNTWHHVAATYNGSTQTIALYIDGYQVAITSATASSNISRLRQQVTPIARMQFASVNSRSQEATSNAFGGMMDEIRLWSREKTGQEIKCQRDIALNGNEAGLVLYYRCNEAASATDLCDATGNGNAGQLQQTTTIKSDRVLKSRYQLSQKTLTDVIQCVNTKTYTFTVSDTTECGSTATLSLAGANRGAFTLSPTTTPLLQNGIPQTITLTYNGNLVGPISALVLVRGNNSCHKPDTLAIDVSRQTELVFSRRDPKARLDTIKFDTLYSGCTKTPFIDSTFFITNNSAQVGTPADKRILSATVDNPAFSVVSFPTVIKPGERLPIVVRYTQQQQTDTAYCKLTLITDDRCITGGRLEYNLMEIEQDILRVTNSDGTADIKSFTFPATCPNQLSDPRNWVWRNITSKPIIIDSMRVPATLTWRAQRFPLTLPPNVGQRPNFFRFKPLVPGVVNDTIIFYSSINGCTIEKRIPYTGRGLANDIEFLSTNVEFGNVIVGQEKTMSVKIRNKSTTDVLRVSLYLERGDVFVFTGAKAVNVNPGAEATLTVTFRPVDSLDYIDKLCLVEQRCFMVDCIPVHGKGVVEKFRYEPLVSETLNVIGCRDSIFTATIRNISTAQNTLNNFRFELGAATKYTLVNPTAFPTSLTLQPNESYTFTIRFTPNDNINDIAFKDYILYETPSGEKWRLQLFATSVTPKLYITPRSVYGSLEAGATKRDTITIENVSPLPVRIDNVTIPAPYVQGWQNRTLPTTLQPRDSIRIEVIFTPTANGTFNDSIRVFGSEPCAGLYKAGSLEGKAIIAKLDRPISLVNFSYARPCDCIDREIPLQNLSHNNPMVIDSLFVDTLGVGANANAKVFSFTSTYYKGSFPYSVPPDSVDLVILRFCPKTPAELRPQFTSPVAKFIINAHGVGWTADYSVFLAGKRSIPYRPAVTNIQFTRTPVDTLSTVRLDSLLFPALDANPDQEDVQVDSITFQPDDRVFLAKDSTGNDITFPFSVTSKKNYKFRFYFRPRAPRLYTARAVIHTSKPCVDKDTTILLTGTGYANPYALGFEFDTASTAIVDTFRVTTCDTFKIPLYVNRAIPAKTVDISSTLLYDTTALSIVSATTAFTQPTFTKPATKIGTAFKLEDCVNVDSAMQLMIVHIVPKQPVRGTYNIVLDTIVFDTKDVLIYEPVALRDSAILVVQQPEIKVTTPIVAFDSVRILDCKTQTLTVHNIGDVPVTVDSLLQLPKGVTFVASTPPRTQRIPVGDSSIVTVEWCPYASGVLDSSSTVTSLAPCFLSDSVRFQGTGYAPSFVSRWGTDSTNFNKPQSLVTRIGDTLTVDIVNEKDYNTTYRNTTYWLQDLRFNVGVQYNPRMLQYLSYTSPYQSNLSVQQSAIDSLTLSFTGISNVAKGKYATLKFLTAVPDAQLSNFIVQTHDFTTDSLLFLDIQDSLSITNTEIVCTERCALTQLSFTNAAPYQLKAATPNPASENVSIEFNLQETVYPQLDIVDINGKTILQVFNGSTQLRYGTYNASINIADIPTGTYVAILRTPRFTATTPVVIIR